MSDTWFLAFVTFFLSLISCAAIADENFYLFGSAGISDTSAYMGIDRPEGDYDRPRQIDSDAHGFTLGGGYAFNEHISLEVAYQNLGQQTGYSGCGPICIGMFVYIPPPPPEAVDSAALSLSLVGSFRINERLSAYGKVGLTDWDLESDQSVFNHSGQDAHYGIGLNWLIDDNWEIFAEHVQINETKIDPISSYPQIRETNLDLVSSNVGIRYHFGRQGR